MSPWYLAFLLLPVAAYVVNALVDRRFYRRLREESA